MAPVSALDPQPPVKFKRKTVPGGRVYTIAGRRWRWQWYNCKPLILIMWAWGAVVAAIPWLWLLK